MVVCQQQLQRCHRVDNSYVYCQTQLTPTTTVQCTAMQHWSHLLTKQQYYATMQVSQDLLSVPVTPTVLDKGFSKFWNKEDPSVNAI